MSDRPYDDSNRGALFRNERKETDKHPDYKGSINVSDHDYWISACLKESHDGEKYLSLCVQLKDGRPAPVAAGRKDEDFGSANGAPRRRSMKDTMDDEIPF